MTPEERAQAWVEDAYLCEHGERNEFRHNYECEICVASLLVGAALRERDAHEERCEAFTVPWEATADQLAFIGALIAQYRRAAIAEQWARWGQAVGQLCDGFDHVRTCRICGEEDAKECDRGGMDAVAAREAVRALLEEAGK